MVDVFVAGSGGQLGFELMRAEWPSGWRVTGKPRRELDISDRGAVRDVIDELRPALIVNAAAYTHVDRAEDEPDRAFAVNRDGAKYLAETGTPLVHVSTDYVFDGAKTGGYVETDSTNPLGVYGRSKLAGEDAVRSANARHVILRCSWVFGEHGHNFVKTMLRLGSERDVLRVVDDQRGCPTPAKAIASAIVQIAARVLGGTAEFGTFHFAGVPPTTWHGFARAIFEARVGHAPEVVPIRSEDFPQKARRAKNSELCSDAIGAAYGIDPPLWRAALPEVIGAIGGGV